MKAPGPTVSEPPRQSPTLLHHRMVRSRGLHGKKPAAFLARWLSDKAMQHARDRIRDLTARSRLRLWPELIAEDLNRFPRGWAACFRFGNSADRFGKISDYARMRMALFLAKRTRRSREFGWAVLACRSGPAQADHLAGIVVAPYPFKDWRVKPNATGERRRWAVCGRTARTVRCGGGWKRSTRPRSRSEAARRGNPGKVAAGPHAGQRHHASPRPYP